MIWFGAAVTVSLTYLKHNLTSCVYWQWKATPPIIAGPVLKSQKPVFYQHKLIDYRLLYLYVATIKHMGFGNILRAGKLVAISQNPKCDY